MGIILKKLTPSPSSIPNNATTSVTIKYNAKTDDSNENIVKLILNIDPGDNIFLRDENGINVKSLSWDQPFPLTLGTLTKQVTIITQVVNLGVFSLRLKATGQLGSTAASNSYITVN